MYILKISNKIYSSECKFSQLNITFFIVWFPRCQVSNKFSAIQSKSGSGIFFCVNKLKIKSKSNLGDYFDCVFLPSWHIHINRTRDYLQWSQFYHRMCPTGKKQEEMKNLRATESGSESNLLLLLRWWRLYRPAGSLLARKRPNFLPCPTGLVLPLLR